MLKTEQKAFETLVEEVGAIEDEEVPEEEAEEVVEVPPEIDEEEDEEDEDEEQEEEGDAGPLSPKKVRVRSAIRVAVKASQDARDSNRLEHVRLAASRLAEVDATELVGETTGVELDLLRDAIDHIIEWAKTAQQALEEQKASEEWLSERREAASRGSA